MRAKGSEWLDYLSWRGSHNPHRLFKDLKPSVHVHKRFGREIEVKYYPNEINKECSLVKEMTL